MPRRSKLSLVLFSVVAVQCIFDMNSNKRQASQVLPLRLAARFSDVSQDQYEHMHLDAMVPSLLPASFSHRYEHRGIAHLGGSGALGDFTKPAVSLRVKDLPMRLDMGPRSPNCLGMRRLLADQQSTRDRQVSLRWARINDCMNCRYGRIIRRYCRDMLGRQNRWRQKGRRTSRSLGGWSADHRTTRHRPLPYVIPRR